MDIEIDTYRPEYLEQQVALGREIRADWPLGGQTSLEQLQKAYSHPDFDPTTKFYAISEGEVVGFVTTSLTGDTASLQFPIVKNNNSEIGRKLLDHVLEELKNRGITTVKARSSPVWGKTEVYAGGYHFEVEEVQLAQGRRLVRALPTIDADETRSLDLENDEDTIRTIFEDKLGYTQDYIERQLQILRDQPQLVMDWRVKYDGTEIIAHAVVINDPVGSDQSYIFHFYADPNHPDVIPSFVKSILADLDQDQLEYISIVLAREQTSFIDIFSDLGFKFTRIMLYTKDL